MELWNFVHDVIGMHVYELLCAITLVVMTVIGIVHSIRQKERALFYERELERIKLEKIISKRAEQEGKDEIHS